MSASLIRTKIKSICQTALGATFRPHVRSFYVQGADSRTLENGFSVLWGQMNEEPSRMDQRIVVSQDFNIQITVRGFVGDSDEKSIDAMDTAYDAIETILNQCVREKIGIDSVMEVRFRGATPPRPFNDNQRDVVQVEVGLTATYLI